MDLIIALLTHEMARKAGKQPLFFSRFTFEHMRRRGNTHYCFLCEGDWGFIPDQNGEATNQLDDDVTLERQQGGLVTVRDALEDATLRMHLADDPGFARSQQAGEQSDQQLEYYAYFHYTPDFVLWCGDCGYRVHRHNPMQRHDPGTHAGAVVGDADKFNSADEWLHVKLPEKFPFVVAVM